MFGKTSFTTVDIYRADGSLVKRLFNSDATTNATNRVEWNVGEIREGIYFYRISNGDNSANGTLVIQD
ncbi:MAG: T9SS type A sorting domain-containing protein [Bacteroidetes bacterium]|nr:T9SS type A sorting domain-containing protein [Bacteroidota bacterium]